MLRHSDDRIANRMTKLVVFEGLTQHGFHFIYPPNMSLAKRVNEVVLSEQYTSLFRFKRYLELITSIDVIAVERF